MSTPGSAAPKGVLRPARRDRAREGAPASPGRPQALPTAAAPAPGRIEAVVIGASAGGVEALSVLLAALPAGSTLAVFVVLHLARERPSLLVDIFAPRCAVAVREAEDKEVPQPGTVYFAPPDYHLLLDRGPRLALSTDPPVHYSRPSVDVLFESAADVYGERLLGLVLTGANQDGAAGAVAIKRAGGAVAVQDPRGAQAPQMPEAAAARIAPDFIGSLAQIAVLLRTLAAAVPPGQATPG